MSAQPAVLVGCGMVLFTLCVYSSGEPARGGSALFSIAEYIHSGVSLSLLVHWRYFM